MEKPKRGSEVFVFLPFSGWCKRKVRLAKKLGFKVEGQLGVYWYSDVGTMWKPLEEPVKAVRPSDFILPGVENG